MPDLEAMTKVQLLGFADSYGITGLNDRMLKAEIVAAIKGAMGW